MQEHDLTVRPRRRFVATTDSDHDGPIFPNLAKDVVPTGPNQLWVADITYIAITVGFVYLAAILDAWSRRVVGYAIGRREEKELLLKEVNHRVKNSLQIVSSVLQLQIPYVESTAAGAADAMRNAAARVLAIAAVHERLYTGEDTRVVRLDSFLSDLCADIGRAYGCPDGIKTDVHRVDVPTDMAIPLALIVNELVTNVVKHVGPPCRVSLRSEVGNALKLTISDKGPGPSEDGARAGLGSRIVDAFATQLGATVETKRGAPGYRTELTVPLPTQ